jgi:Tfp pilus assembly protein PilF
MLRSKEFIRKDPSYYVGYMLEGLYRYDRAGDLAGYVQAAKPLKQAMALFETDYKTALRDIYSSEEAYAEYGDKVKDYVHIVDKLMECYSHVERPDSVIWLLNRYKSWNFSHDELGADNYIAWTYHRNRFLTSKNFDFLYNSVNENEMTALYFLRQNLENIDKNAAKNEKIINPLYIIGSKLSAYHYLAIVYSYLHKSDSAAMYFNYMRPYRVFFPYNNYAIFCFVNGEFDDAHNYFRYSQLYTSRRYGLNESVYYTSMLDAMRATPQESVAELSQYIRETGVRPGWGWYNIGLARALMYCGQLDSSMICINKAAKFNDVHIGTTWGQNLYMFSHSVLRYIVLQRREAAIYFEDKYYWLSPSKLKQLAELKLEQYLMKLLIFNQLSINPERAEVYYRLFASEATISFDEIYQAIKDYGRKFFIKEFSRQAETDERKNIRKYFSLFCGKLHLERGDTKNALKIFDELVAQNNPDKEFEKLYQARLYEALTLANESEKEYTKSDKFRLRFYSTYPQLMPFSNVKMKFNLKIETADNEISGRIMDDLKSFNIDFTGTPENNIPTINLHFEKINGKNCLKYYVTTDWGSAIIEPSTITYTKPEGVARKLAYSLFKLKV